MSQEVAFHILTFATLQTEERRRDWEGQRQIQCKHNVRWLVSKAQVSDARKQNQPIAQKRCRGPNLSFSDLPAVTLHALGNNTQKRRQQLPVQMHS